MKVPNPAVMWNQLDLRLHYERGASGRQKWDEHCKFEARTAGCVDPSRAQTTMCKAKTKGTLVTDASVSDVATSNRAHGVSNHLHAGANDFCQRRNRQWRLKLSPK